jgi:hypothetical protein
LECTWTVTTDNLSLVDIINDNNEEPGYHSIELCDWARWDENRADIDEVLTPMLNKTYDNGHPNPTSEPEWDVLHEIKWTFSNELQGGKLVHTKGHQDDTHNYEKLPSLAQLNIDADKLAGQFQNRYGKARPACSYVFRIMLLKCIFNKVQLHPACHLCPAIGRAKAPPFDSTSASRTHGRNRSSRMINWPVHAAMIKAHNKQRIHFAQK